ncbi:MAG: hypothetical protein ACJ75Z_13935 [Solirubrobacterales bacterium]
MAQTKKKRRRKHRGTQGGRIDTRPARGRARSRAEAQSRARSRTKKKSGPRVPGPPSISSSLKKGAIAAVLFVGLLALFGQNPVGSLVGGIVILPFYALMAYTMDGFFYRRHLRKEAQKRVEKEQQRAGHAEG